MMPSKWVILEVNMHFQREQNKKKSNKRELGQHVEATSQSNFPLASIWATRAGAQCRRSHPKERTPTLRTRVYSLTAGGICFLLAFLLNQPEAR